MNFIGLFFDRRGMNPSIFKSPVRRFQESKEYLCRQFMKKQQKMLWNCFPNFRDLLESDLIRDLEQIGKMRKLLKWVTGE